RTSLLPRASPLHRHPHSFPTRRSSDLARFSDGRPPASLVGGDRVGRGAPGPLRLRSQTGFDRHAVARRTAVGALQPASLGFPEPDRKSTRLNSSHQIISYAVFCLKKKK